MTSPLSIVTGAVKNFQPTTSVMAGGAASILTFAAGCALVAAGIALPFGLGPITMTMVAAAAPVVGHVVTSLVPDSVNQTLQGLANKLQIAVADIKIVTPEVEYTYPGDPTTPPTPNNLTNG